MLKSNINVLMVSKTKIDNSCPVGNFVTDGFGTPYRLDHDSNGGDTMLYVREDFPSNFLASDEKNQIKFKIFHVKLNLYN